MYTGIVQAVAPVTQIIRHDGYTQFHIEFPERLIEGLQIGGSVSVEGVCLSATSITGRIVTGGRARIAWRRDPVETG